MGKIIRLCLAISCVGFLGICASGCSDGSPPVGVTSYKRDVDLPQYVEKPKPRNTGMSPDNPVTGVGPWATGRASQPEPKALEKTDAVSGKVSSVGGGSFTMDIDKGGQRTFTVDQNTFIFRSGDSRFFQQPFESINQGGDVTVQGYQKGGQWFASTVKLGTRPFGGGNNNNNNNNE